MDCFLELFMWGGLTQACGSLGRVIQTAESDGLSILRMKSWFTSASAIPREHGSLYCGVLSSYEKE